MFDDNYVELDEYIGQIDEAKKKNGKKLTDEELEDAQEFADDTDFTIE